MDPKTKLNRPVATRNLLSKVSAERNDQMREFCYPEPFVAGDTFSVKSKASPECRTTEPLRQPHWRALAFSKSILNAARFFLSRFQIKFIIKNVPLISLQRGKHSKRIVGAEATAFANLVEVIYEFIDY